MNLVHIIMIIVFLMALFVLILFTKTKTIDSTVLVEHFKRKKKGKKEMDKDSPSIDLDELALTMEKSKEEETEGDLDDPEIGDPEDDDLEDSSYVSSMISDNMKAIRDKKIARMKAQAQQASITVEEENPPNAFEKEFIISDLLSFKILETNPNAKMICVLPDTPLCLLVMKTPFQNGKGILVGTGEMHEDVIIPEAYPDGMNHVTVAKKNTNLNEAIVDKEFIIYFGPFNKKHALWTALLNQPQPISFVHFVEKEGRSAMFTSYPYCDFTQMVDVETLLPGKLIDNKFVIAMFVPMCIYSTMDFIPRFYTLYDYFSKTSHLNEQQTYFEFFFPFYREILTDKVEIQPSFGLKEYFQEKTVLKNPFLNRRASFNINGNPKSLIKKSYVRDIFQEYMISLDDLKEYIKAEIHIGDVIVFTLLKMPHMYLSNISTQNGLALLQSHWLIKNKQEHFTFINSNKVMCKKISKYVRNRLQVHDKVFFDHLDCEGQFLFKSDGYYFSITDDKKEKDKMLKCYTNPDYKFKEACISEFDHFGKLKKNGSDIWDRPCLYNEECPFYEKGKYMKTRGGCLESGYCEMPIGFENLSYRYYTNISGNKDKDTDTETQVRYPGDFLEFIRTPPS